MYRGVLLAGGNGTRMRPLTEMSNKHLLPVYNKLMIEYPLRTLINMGCTEIILVTGGEHIGGFAWYLGDGSKFGVKITYRIQSHARGVAHALGHARGLVDGLFPVILGDNYFQDEIKMPDTPAIYVKKVKDPNRFGVYKDRKITEKPKRYISDLAVTGLYVYDSKVFDLIDTLSPSERGEYEITDINNYYLSWGARVIKIKGEWSDMGTFDSLLDVANMVRENG